MWKRAGTLKSQGWRATCVIFRRTWVGVGGGRGISWRISLTPFEEPWTIAVLVVGRGSIVGGMGLCYGWKVWSCRSRGKPGDKEPRNRLEGEREEVLSRGFGEK